MLNSALFFVHVQRYQTVWHYSGSEWMQLAKSRFKTRCLDPPAKCLSRGDPKLFLSACLPGCFELPIVIYFAPFREFWRMPKWDVPFDKFVDGFSLSCQYRSFFKKYIFIKRKSYKLKSFFVFLVGDVANEENEERGGWRSYVYRSSWKSFSWCSHIRRLDSRTQSRKGKQPIRSCSWWRNRSHSCSYGRTWFSRELTLISFETLMLLFNV